MWRALAVVLLSCAVAAQATRVPPEVLPERATAILKASLEAAEAHARHVWRDTAPINDDGTINAYVEISRGERRKFEFDMGTNTRALDRVIPEDIGGYPVNYGFVPQTVSYDGDPFDALVLGPPLEGGVAVRGLPVGLMLMEDEKGVDSKVVLSLAGAGFQPRHTLTKTERQRIGEYFRNYKKHEPGGFSRVPGWGTAVDGVRHVEMTHAFFLECRTQAAGPCRIAP